MYTSLWRSYYEITGKINHDGRLWMRRMSNDLASQVHWQLYGNLYFSEHKSICIKVTKGNSFSGFVGKSKIFNICYIPAYTMNLMSSDLVLSDVIKAMNNNFHKELLLTDPQDWSPLRVDQMSGSNHKRF
jgi:hypothetical protein